MTSIDAALAASANAADDLTAGRGGWDRSEYGDGQFESGFFGSHANGERWAAWHGLGTLLDQPNLKTADAIKLAGLDWNVETYPLTVALPDGTQTTSKSEVVQVRSDTKNILGVVGKGYQTIQNTERFDFMDELLQTDEAKWHTAGVLKGGRQVWMLAELPKTIQIGGVEDETLKLYLLLTDGTNGTAALKVAVTPVRVACVNTTRLAIKTTPRLWVARHTRSLQGRMTEARTTLQLTYRYIDAFQKQADALLGSKISKSEFASFVENLVPLPTKNYKGTDISDGDRIYLNAQERRESLLAIYNNAENLANIKGTKWGALQAVTEYIDWKPSRVSAGATGERALAVQEAAWNRRLSQPAESLKDTALELLTR